LRLIRKKLASSGLLKGLGTGFTPSGSLRGRFEILENDPRVEGPKAGTMMIPVQFRLHLGFSIGQFTNL
jgi:hypothetical protein